MINFIECVFRFRPHIKSLKTLQEDELIQLVNEFEGGKLSGNWQLTEKWKSGFYFCIHGSGSMDNYDIAELNWQVWKNLGLINLTRVFSRNLGL